MILPHSFLPLHHPILVLDLISVTSYYCTYIFCIFKAPILPEWPEWLSVQNFCVSLYIPEPTPHLPPTLTTRSPSLPPPIYTGYPTYKHTNIIYNIVQITTTRIFLQPKFRPSQSCGCYTTCEKHTQYYVSNNESSKLTSLCKTHDYNKGYAIPVHRTK